LYLKQMGVVVVGSPLSVLLASAHTTAMGSLSLRDAPADAIRRDDEYNTPLEILGDRTDVPLPVTLYCIAEIAVVLARSRTSDSQTVQVIPEDVSGAHTVFVEKNVSDAG